MPDTDIQRALGRIEGKLDGVLLTQSHQHTRLNDHSGRLDKIEKRTAMWAGGIATVSSLISWLGLDYFTRGQ